MGRLGRPTADISWGPFFCGSEGATATDVTVRGVRNGGVAPESDVVIEVREGLSTHFYKRAFINQIGTSTA